MHHQTCGLSALAVQAMGHQSPPSQPLPPSPPAMLCPLCPPCPLCTHAGPPGSSSHQGPAPARPPGHTPAQQPCRRRPQSEAWGRAACSRAGGQGRQVGGRLAQQAAAEGLQSEGCVGVAAVGGGHSVCAERLSSAQQMAGGSGRTQRQEAAAGSSCSLWLFHVGLPGGRAGCPALTCVQGARLCCSPAGHPGRPIWRAS